MLFVFLLLRELKIVAVLVLIEVQVVLVFLGVQNSLFAFAAAFFIAAAALAIFILLMFHFPISLVLRRRCIFRLQLSFLIVYFLGLVALFEVMEVVVEKVVVGLLLLSGKAIGSDTRKMILCC